MPESRRFCPNRNCNMPIERNRGCNHFQCTMCKVHFCWLCKDFQVIFPIKMNQNFHVCRLPILRRSIVICMKNMAPLG